jgi:hypothetical protein
MTAFADAKSKYFDRGSERIPRIESMCAIHMKACYHKRKIVVNKFSVKSRNDSSRISLISQLHIEHVISLIEFYESYFCAKSVHVTKLNGLPRDDSDPPSV